MSNRLFITIRTPSSNQEIDLEFPGDQIIGESLPNILKILNWPLLINGKDVKYFLQTKSGSPLENSKTLNSYGFQNFEVLWLTAQEENFVTVKVIDDSCGEIVNGEQEVRNGILPPPQISLPVIDQPSLVISDSYMYILLGSEITVGRKSKESTPDIDITEFDSGFVASRKHISIIPRGGKHYCKPFSTRNGTYLNGKQLEPEKEVLLSRGDTIQLGFRGIELVYQTPN